MVRSNVSPQATAAAEEMPEECSQTPAGTAPGGTGPAEPDLPNRNTESNSKAKANTGAANGGGKGNEAVYDASPEIGPPFYLRNRFTPGFERCSMHGTVGGIHDLVVTSMTYCQTRYHEKLMRQLLGLARAGSFKTKADAVKQRDELIPSRPFSDTTDKTPIAQYRYRIIVMGHGISSAS